MAVGLVVVTVAVGLALHVTSVAPEILWSVKVRQAAAHHLPQLDDYISDDELRWTTWTRSVIHCADLCARDVTCLAFTATTVTSRGVECRGHCGLGPGSTLGNRANTRAYSLQVLTWLDKTCTKDSDCTHPKSVCFAGHCLCSPGFFYSHSRDECLADCTDADLKPLMVSYPGWYIFQHNLNSSVTSWAECVEWCSMDPACRTFEYNFSSSTCFLAHVTALQEASYWRAQDNDDINHYMKTCA
ncbi:uncharacterized protein LOC112558921 [Pomacea canaliculata]|uniref:uncharacterized protein LOC112558921 n=1 Tax=Pomacea canaliculata TaxID=400727 RepID=UPI000D738DFA|nr:uncharacterized protein LOC112558921 [Pomacea canaliculata]XP_025085466.1 uncharacterized protein LOC112558921 [Pomacea canaliculata]